MMDALRLDYYAKAKPVWIGLLVLFLGSTAALFAGWRVNDQNRKIEEAELHLQHIVKSTEVRPGEDDKASAAQISEANAVIQRLNLPWEALFNAIELTSGKDVVLLDLKPDVQKGTVRISAEAKSLESQLDYISLLQQNTLFQDVTLLSHQVHDQDPQNPVRFVLQAKWRRLR